MWTEEEIRGRTAISTAVFQNVTLGPAEIEAVKAAGIDRIEVSVVRRSFDDRNERQVRSILEACRSNDVEVVSVHEPFDLPYREEGPEAEAAIVEGSLPAIAFAEAAGARHYVGHFGLADRAKRLIGR